MRRARPGSDGRTGAAPVLPSFFPRVRAWFRRSTLRSKTVGDALTARCVQRGPIEELLGEDAWSTALEDGPCTSGACRRARSQLRSACSSWSCPVRRRRADTRSARRPSGALERTGLAQVGKKRSRRGAHRAGRRRPARLRPPLDRPDRRPARLRLDLLADRAALRPAHPAPAGRSGRSTSAPATASRRCSQRSHSQHVVATDVNPRALAFTELNAALSGLDNVECRRGSLFEPVEGEQFDLIVCNAPFVVSPERRWTYRDGCARRRRALGAGRPRERRRTSRPAASRR